ncbi:MULTISPECIES: hypothetical protein [Eggerthella]|uniref:hypothetical protein n=1 Tax=Eggerthella TaxID=84111 RepID=UPI00070F9D97|nr:MULTISPECIES: hypothetical protein [Eggerthella]MBS6970272.1 hypothetical protein [Eggerthella sp.]MCB6941118.1 hypothetical protein [Eggerthella lenta]MCB7057632.1 hypothetical protein [Eggerthella lenta]MCQ5139331.1 hypothetical protein [Eggerthella lenta]MDB1777516.1 hypothetical protein [Eggerthella lenta]
MKVRLSSTVDVSTKVMALPLFNDYSRYFTILAFILTLLLKSMVKIGIDGIQKRAEDGEEIMQRPASAP